MRPRIGITSTPTMQHQRRIDRVNRWYVDAVARAGGLPLILPTMAPANARETLAGLDGLVLTGGGDVAPWLYGEEPAADVYDVDTARDAWELALVGAATGGPHCDWGASDWGDGEWDDSELPILGVCRGAQLLNVAAGGTLIQHLPDRTSEAHRQRERDEEPVHDIEVDPNSRLAGILGRRRLGVNSIHHQAIARLGQGFHPVAWSPDGVIEAIERSDGAPVVAVQWHPESLVERAPHGQLFLWLTRSAAGHRPHLGMPDSFDAAAPTSAGLGHLVDDLA